MAISTTALATIAAVTSGVGMGLSAFGMYRQGQAAEATADYNAKVAEANAKQTEASAQYEEHQQRDQARKLLARQRVMYAKSGVNLDSGSPLLTMATDASAAENDAQMIRYNGLMKATSYRNQAIGEQFQGKQAYQAGVIGAGATLLQGIGNMGMNYLKTKKPSGYSYPETYGAYYRARG